MQEGAFGKPSKGIKLSEGRKEGLSTISINIEIEKKTKLKLKSITADLILHFLN
jgi:hypothetical protein